LAIFRRRECLNLFARAVSSLEPAWHLDVAAGAAVAGVRRGAAPRRIQWAVGAADRLDFTAIGPAVNQVSRLEGLCRPLGRTVLISGAVAAETNAKLIPLGTHALRGIAAPCAVYTLPDP
jgi:class 3 adenylate cyclase